MSVFEDLIASLIGNEDVSGLVDAQPLRRRKVCQRLYETARRI